MTTRIPTRRTSLLALCCWIVAGCGGNSEIADSKSASHESNESRKSKTPEEMIVGTWSPQRSEVNPEILKQALKEFANREKELWELKSYAVPGKISGTSPDRSVRFQSDGTFHISQQKPRKSSGSGTWSLKQIDGDRWELAVVGDRRKSAHIEWTGKGVVTFVNNNEFHYELRHFKPGLKVVIYERITE